MRLGIMAMQIGSLIPPGLSQAAVMSHVAGFDHAQLVRELHSHGFDPVELGGDLAMFMPQTYSPPAIERLAALRHEQGVNYTVHLPLWSVEPSTPLAPVREGSVRAVVECIRATQPLAPEVYVLHATGALAAEFYRMHFPEMAHGLVLGQFQNGSRASIQAILTQTKIPTRQLATETIEFPLEMTSSLAEELDLSLCFDTGHVLTGLAGDHDLFDALDRCLPRLAEVHLHDAPRHNPGEKIAYGQDHQRLGTRNLDVGRLLDRLDQAGFMGPVVLELTVPEALASRDYIRSIRPGFLV